MQMMNKVKLERGKISQMMSRKWLQKKKSMETLIWTQKMKAKKNSTGVKEAKATGESCLSEHGVWITIPKAACIAQGYTDFGAGHSTEGHTVMLHFQTQNVQPCQPPYSSAPNFLGSQWNTFLF